MPAYSVDEQKKIRRLADAGVSWYEIGQALGRSAAAVECAARRMRQRGAWPENPASVREPSRGRSGRPRNRKRTKAVSVRFSAEVADELRHVAHVADFESRVGKVLTEAIKRAVNRAKHDRLRLLTPFGLDRAENASLDTANRAETMSVCVDAQALASLVKLHPGKAPTAVVHDAAVQLLRDLGYTVT